MLQPRTDTSISLNGRMLTAAPGIERRSPSMSVAGHVHIVEWGRSQNCPWDRDASLLIGVHVSDCVAEWLGQKGCLSEDDYHSQYQ